MTITWAFAGFTFPADSLPFQSGNWDIAEKVIEHEPLSANVTTITSFGFKSNMRTISGECSRSFRDTMETLRLALTIGALVDGEGRSITARIMLSDFKPLGSNNRWTYSITFKAR